MEIFNCFTIDNYLTLITIFLMVSGGIFALIQWNSTKKLRRAEFIDKILNQIRFNKEMAETMYIIDYNYGWYSEEFHNNPSGLEFKIDKLLSYVDFICYLYNMKNISLNELKILKYEIIRICISPSVQAYLWNLYHFSKKMKTNCSFINIIDYGMKHKLLKSEFKDNNIDLYVKTLNF